MSDERSGLGGQEPAAQRSNEAAQSAQRSNDSAQAHSSAQRSNDPAQAHSSAQRANDSGHGSHGDTQRSGVRRSARAVQRGAKNTQRLVRIGLAGAAGTAAVSLIVFAATRHDTQRRRPSAAPTSVSATDAGQRAEAPPSATVSGHLDPQGATTFPFTVEAGTVNYFASAPDCTATELQWDVEDSAGVALSAAAVICGDIGRIEFEKAGAYQMRVYSVGASGGDFSVIREDSRPDRHLAIKPGDNLQGNIDLPGAQDVYEFDADAGIVAYFDSADCATNGLQWVIEDADSGAPIVGAAVICDPLGRIDFQASGHYLVRVYSVSGGTGTYEVKWKQSRPDETFAISSGETVRGDTDLPGSQDLYTFEVGAGTVAYFAAVEDCTGNNQYWVLENEAGSPFAGTSVMCNDIGRVVFDTAGRYRLRVYSVDGGTGTYGLTWVTSRPDKARSVTIGSSASGAIDVPGGRDIWTFMAPLGGSVVLTAQAGCENLDLRWMVQTPDGMIVKPVLGACSDIDKVELPGPGDYQVVVFADGPATGAYTFDIAPG